MPDDLDSINAYRQAWFELARPRFSVHKSNLYPQRPPIEIGYYLANFDLPETPLSDNDPAFEAAEYVVKKYGKALLHEFPMASAVAVSLKFSNGRIDPSQPAVTFFVGKKLEAKRLGNCLIPQSIDGVPTDVVEAGIPRTLSAVPTSHTPGTKFRPAQPGTSVAHLRVTSGTFGCLVEDSSSKYILSCAHVLSDASAAAGDPILHPATHYGGSVHHDQIARLTKSVPLASGTCIADAAIAELNDPINVIPDILGIGKPTGVRTLNRVGLGVQKSGDQTGVTLGVVAGLRGTVGPLQINGAANVYFDNVILTTGMSDGGDSGSLLMDNSRRAIGLLFGGIQSGSNYSIGWYHPIDVVLGNLGVSLVL